MSCIESSTPSCRASRSKRGQSLRGPPSTNGGAYESRSIGGESLRVHGRSSASAPFRCANDRGLVVVETHPGHRRPKALEQRADAVLGDRLPRAVHEPLVRPLGRALQARLDDLRGARRRGERGCSVGRGEQEKPSQFALRVNPSCKYDDAGRNARLEGSRGSTSRRLPTHPRP